MQEILTHFVPRSQFYSLMECNPLLLSQETYQTSGFGCLQHAPCKAMAPHSAVCTNIAGRPWEVLRKVLERWGLERVVVDDLVPCDSFGDTLYAKGEDRVRCGLM